MKILNLVASPRGAASQSIQLGTAILNKIQDKYPDSTVTTHNLTETLYPHLEALHLDSFATALPNRTPELQGAAQYSEQAIKELFAADRILISAPM